MVDYPEYSGVMKDWPQVAAVEGTIETLRKFSSSYNCYLATNARDSSKEDICEALERVGLNVYLKDIFCFQALGFSKPDARFYQAIAQKLDINISDLLMVGDDLQKDVQGALDAGANAVWFNPEGKPVEGYLSVKSFHELSDVLTG